MSTITITRAERDLIYGEMWRWAPSHHLDVPLPFDTRDEAEASIRYLHRAMLMFDEIGWANKDSRDAFAITVDAALIDFIRRTREAATDARDRNLRYRETHILSGRKSRYGDHAAWADDYKTLNEANEAIDRYTAVAEHELHVCEQLLERMDFDAVTA